MLSLFKWIYRLGVLHERRRIKLFISEHRLHKPQLPMIEDDLAKEQYNKRLNLWHEVNDELEQLLDPQLAQQQYMEALQAPPAPIDQD